MTDDFEFEDEGSGDSDKGSRSNSQQIFNTRVTKKIKQLSAKNPAARREAAYWLGESGEPKAITSLVKVYRKDKDKSVREAARYALSMFRALEKALEGSEDEQNHALDMIGKIVNEGKMGKRARLSPASLVRVEIGLVVLLVVIVLLGIIRTSTKGGGQNTDAATPTLVANSDGTPVGPNTLVIVEELKQHTSDIRSDIAALQQQFLTIQTGGKLNCTLKLKTPQPYSLRPEVASALPSITTAADQVNAAQASLSEARVVFDNSCKEGAAPLSSIDADQLVKNLTTLLSDTLPKLDTVLSEAEAASKITPTAPPPTAGPPTETPIPLPTNTPTPAPTVTPFPVQDISRTLTEMEFKLDQVTGSGGAATLLNQYWQDVTSFGKTDGCLFPVPDIPGDQPVSTDENLLKALPELAEAINSVNLGLTQARQSSSIFQNACVTGDLSAQAPAGAAFIGNAKAAFENARSSIDVVRKKLRR